MQTSTHRGVCGLHRPVRSAQAGHGAQQRWPFDDEMVGPPGPHCTCEVPRDCVHRTEDKPKRQKLPWHPEPKETLRVQERRDPSPQQHRLQPEAAKKAVPPQALQDTPEHSQAHTPRPSHTAARCLPSARPRGPRNQLHRSILECGHLPRLSGEPGREWEGGWRLTSWPSNAVVAGVAGRAS